MQLSGLAVCDGIVIGKAYPYQPFDISAVLESDRAGPPDEMLTRYRREVESARGELNDLIAELERSDPDKAKLLFAHQMVLDDTVMDEEIRGMLHEGETSVALAIDTVYELFIGVLKDAEDEMIQERVSDLRDVRIRLLRCLSGQKEENLSSLPEPVVVVARELFPSDTTTLDRKNVLAIVAEAGGATSHTAIVAKSYGIPTILGVRGAMEAISGGDILLVDASEGVLHINPDRQLTDSYRQRMEELELRRERAKRFRGLAAVTTDGVRVEVELNISSAASVSSEDIACSDGSGLFRTELLYMERNTLPDEEEQFTAYREVLAAFGEKPVILRTLDIGGDKSLPCLPLPEEDNPFLGNRAIRLCFSRPELLLTQLRAALRASVYGNLRIMFPMVGSMDDFRRAKEAFEQARAELALEGILHNPNLMLGVMVEIPALAIIADKIAKEADFASIGTNDLCQYLMAADRLNEEVAPYCQQYHPALLRTVGYVASRFALAGKPLGVCGEMAGNPMAIVALVGLGVKALSMSASSLAEVKRTIIGISAAQAAKLAQTLCDMDTAAEVEAELRRFYSGISH